MAPPPKRQTTGTLGVTFDAGASVIAVDSRSDLHINFVGAIKDWTILADQSGSIVIDIWRSSYGNFPPTAANSITASLPPKIVGNIKASSSELFETGWNTRINPGDVLRFNVNSCTSIKRAVLILKIIKTD